jgi:superfamily II DNA or RNA helicase
LPLAASDIIFDHDSSRRHTCLAIAEPTMTLQFSVTDLSRQLGAETLDKGEFLWLDDCVRLVEVTANGTHILGSVSGSRPRPYSQTIMLGSHGGSVTIKGYCDCRVGLNCQHVAAVLLQHLELLKKDNAAPPTELAPPLSSPSRTVIDTPAKAALARPIEPRAALSDQVTQWLDRLAWATTPPVPSGRPANPNQRQLRYVLNPEHAYAGTPPVRIRAVTVRLRKDGSVIDEKPYDPENATRSQEQRARFLTEADCGHLRDLMWLKRARSNFGGSDIPLGPDAASLGILMALLRSGRLRFGKPSGPELHEGPARRAVPRWIGIGRNEQRLTLVPERQAAGSDGDAKELPAEAVKCFDHVLALSPPHYVDLAIGQLGAIDTHLPPQVAVEVARAPAIAVSEAAMLKELMRQRLRTPQPQASAEGTPQAGPEPGDPGHLPLPEAPENVEVRAVTPVPRLDLMVARVRPKSNYFWYMNEAHHCAAFPLPLARLSFDYGNEIIASTSPVQTLERVEADRLILMPRDTAHERKAGERLAAVGLKSVSGLPFDVAPEHVRDLFIAPPGQIDPYRIIANINDPARYIAFSADVVPLLVRDGWQVAFSDDYPYRIAEGDAQWWADIGEGSGIDWFSFELGIEFEGHRINLVPHLTEMLGKLPVNLPELAFAKEADDEFTKLCNQHKLYHSLADGRLLPLPGARLAPLLKALLMLIGPRGQRLAKNGVKLHRAEAGALAAFAGEAGVKMTWAASATRLIELGHSLRRGRGLQPVAPAKSFRGTLRPYQADGLAWLDFLRDAGFGGVLADDMGLGKTVQALAFLAREKEQGRLTRPALIVCPTSVLPNWLNEVQHFAPTLAVLPLRGLNRKEAFAGIPNSDLVITTYPLLARDHEVLLAHEFHAVLLDEAQAIKNPKAAVSGLAHRINARHRFALTGTPIENNLGEVWSLFEFLNPGLLGDETTFRRTLRIPIEKHGDARAQVFLSQRLKPFMLRRTKEEVATELPPKTEIVELVRLEGAQRDLYETVRALMHAKVRDEIARRGLAKSHIIFLDALLKLRQICCDPRLLKLPQARHVRGSAKYDRLMEMIRELVSEGRRILVFSQFTSMLALIEEGIATLKIPYVMLTGDTVDRTTPVREFQAGKVPLFLLSLKAGGTGLNLTAADTVIHYDPWWNPAVENQATDRAHRIGQHKPVFVYKLIVEEGIEGAIELLKARKAALAEALFAGGAKTPFDLTEADISALFAPLDLRPDRRAA